MLILLAEILALNKSALCRSASLAFSFAKLLGGGVGGGSSGPLMDYHPIKGMGE